MQFFSPDSYQTGQTWSYICSDSFSSSEQFPRLEYDGGDNEGGGVADDVANESLLSSKAISGGGGEKSSGGGGEKSSSSIPPFPSRSKMEMVTDGHLVAGHQKKQIKTRPREVTALVWLAVNTL